MQLFNTVGNHVSVIERKYWPAEMSDAGRAQVDFLRDQVLFAIDPKMAHDSALQLLHTEPEEEKRYLAVAGKETEDERLFVVWSQKTSLWIRRQSTDPIFSPVNKPPEYVDVVPFLDPKYFTPVFKYGKCEQPESKDCFLYIWEVKQQPSPD